MKTKCRLGTWEARSVIKTIKGMQRWEHVAFCSDYKLYVHTHPYIRVITSIHSHPIPLPLPHAFIRTFLPSLLFSYLPYIHTCIPTRPNLEQKHQIRFLVDQPFSAFWSFLVVPPILDTIINLNQFASRTTMSFPRLCSKAGEALWPLAI